MAALHVDKCRFRRLAKGLQGLLEPSMVHSGLGESQTALPPNNASEFLNEVLFGWALRLVLVRERRNNSGVLGPILPWQDGVAGEDPVPKRVEARELCSPWP